MADLATPRAARLQRPSWRDSRLVVGVLLVLVAVALGAKVVSAADDTTAVYAAARTLVAGQPVAAADLRRVDVQLNGDLAGYVPAARVLLADVFALREVRPGELVPASALGTRTQVAVKAVTVPADRAAMGRLLTGSIVDVWVNAKVDGVGPDAYGEPKLLLESALVAGVPDAGAGGFGGTSGASGVQVLVPDERVVDLIGAIDQGAKVTLVPVPGSPLKDPW